MNHEPLLKFLIEFRWMIFVIWVCFSIWLGNKYEDSKFIAVIAFVALVVLIIIVVFIVIHDDGPPRPPIFPFNKYG